MYKLKELENALKRPKNIITSFALLIGVASLFRGLDPIRALLGAAAVALLIPVVIMGVNRLIRLLIFSRRPVEMSLNPTDLPTKYKVEPTLRMLKNHAGKLEIIGRTCFRWLCGEGEKTFQTDPESFLIEKQRIQRLALDAIRAGSEIHFILQNPNISLPQFNAEENTLLRKHLEAAINSHNEIVKKLRTNEKKRFTLSFFNSAVENSMVRLSKDDKVIRFVFDISVGFKSTGRVSKPTLIVRPDADVFFKDVMKEFDHVTLNAIHAEQLQKEKENAEKRADSLIQQYSHHSSQRQDRSGSLASKAAELFLADRQGVTGVPPVSIQILVTNHCTTFCTMCSHFQLPSHNNRRNELTRGELNCIFQWITDLGTKSIILSGGEPLARQDIFELLRDGKDKGLHIGLLTNGIVSEGRRLTSDQAKVISETCSWVQVSLDSFNKETYAKIRKGSSNHFETVLSSLASLKTNGVKNVEICFTIQQDNYHEINKDLPGLVNSLLPAGVPVRFKIAHGPTSPNSDFICTTEQWKSVITNLPDNNDRFNSQYLRSMIHEEFFDSDGLAQGVPLRKKMIVYQTKGYTCQAIQLTCLIDPYGYVYPCCYLFDDNNATSSIRDQYRIDSLRDKKLGIVTCEPGRNLLAEIWFKNERLKILRRDVLPVDTQACYYCTRHAYQNEYLNELQQILKDRPHHGLAEKLASLPTSNSKEAIWI